MVGAPPQRSSPMNTAGGILLGISISMAAMMLYLPMMFASNAVDLISTIKEISCDGPYCSELKEAAAASSELGLIRALLSWVIIVGFFDILAGIIGTAAWQMNNKIMNFVSAGLRVLELLFSIITYGIMFKMVNRSKPPIEERVKYDKDEAYAVNIANTWSSFAAQVSISFIIHNLFIILCIAGQCLVAFSGTPKASAPPPPPAQMPPPPVAPSGAVLPGPPPPVGVPPAGVPTM